MEDKQLTEKESIALITEMISRTKRRYIGNGDNLLMWGYLVVAVSVAVWALLYFTHNQAWNWLWFLIPVVGGILTPIMVRKERLKAGAKNYSDSIISRFWTACGLSELAAILACFGFMLIGGIDCWVMMLMFSLIVVSIIEMAQGIVLNENCFIFGGAAGLAVGILTCCCVAGGIPLGAAWYMPLFILAFVAMMIIPGHIINHKAKTER